MPPKLQLYTAMLSFTCSTTWVTLPGQSYLGNPKMEPPHVLHILIGLHS